MESYIRRDPLSSWHWADENGTHEGPTAEIELDKASGGARMNA
jgi:hypothetical protein